MTLRSKVKNYTYIGITNNLDRRLKEHNEGYNKTTKPYIPFKLIYKEVCEDRTSARQREKYFKSGVGREYLKALVG